MACLKTIRHSPRQSDDTTEVAITSTNYNRRIINTFGAGRATYHCQSYFCSCQTGEGAVKQIRTRIGLQDEPKSTRSIIDATQREQWHGSA